MHKLLARQLRRHLATPDQVPEALAPLLSAVDDAYRQADEEREQLERSVETVSSELVDRFQKLRDALAESDRTRAELERTLAMVEATLEATADGVLVVDRAGRVVRTNARFAELWELPAPLRAQWTDTEGYAYLLSQLRDADRVRDHMLAVHADADQSSFDLLDFKDGRIFEAQSRPQRVGGVNVGRVWTFRDLTERRQLEDQLRQAQKMEAVGRLAGGVAHDFNNLLTVIQGNIDFVEETLGAGSRVRGDLAEIREAAERASGLTQQLLAFSRKQVVQPEPLDLSDVVICIEPMIRRLIGEDIRIATQLNEACHTVVGDRGQLEQVLMNLAVNARDAMPQGGDLTISVGCAAVTEDESAANRGIPPVGNYATLVVSDTGMGIPAEMHERIFEPFVTTKEAGHGTGLGLAMVYGVVKQSDGWIRLDSEEGRGTTFTIYFPIAEGLQPAEAVTPAPIASVHGAETILVAEDNASVRDLIFRTLTPLGYRLIVARDGEDGMLHAASTEARVDLVLSDVIMPTYSGRELVDFARGIWPAVRVLFISGYTDDELGRGGVLQPDTDFLPKPFTGKALAMAVRAALDSTVPGTATVAHRPRAPRAEFAEA